MTVLKYREVTQQTQHRSQTVGWRRLLVHIHPALADVNIAVCTMHAFESSLGNDFLSYAEISVCGENNACFPTPF